jgi:NADPH:quinone reductase-like Zn-dependent oxidoreductase
MQAMISHEYGELKLEEIDRPELEPDSVLVRVRAAAANPLDYHELRGTPYFARALMGFRKPKQSSRGVDAAGTVEAVGANVTEFQPGDDVFGSCRGAFGEYARGTEGKLAAKPAGLTFEAAAAMPVAGVTALQALRDRGAIQAGQRVLINGAAGGVGTFAVQIAKTFGAHVTGVCSGRNVDLVRSIGADDVVDYELDDFTRSEHSYDLILDTVGNRSLRELRRALKAKGTLVVIGGGGGRLLGPVAQLGRALLLSRFLRQNVNTLFAKIRKEDLVFLKELVDGGKLTPVIDRTYRLSEASDAIRYLEQGHARGKVVITVSP